MHKTSEKIGYAAFLRGINVGGHRLVKMTELQKAFESLGFERVKTLLASGNVRFVAPKANPAELTRKIERKLEKAFGHSIVVILRTGRQLEKIIESDPFKDVRVTLQTRLFVTFLAEKPRSALETPYESPQKDFRILQVLDDHVFSVLRVASIRAITSMNVLEKEFGRKITTRTWNTVKRMAKAGGT